MTEGKIVSWNKKVGDKISSGDVVLVVESDKADMDVESYEEGYLAKIITPEGGSAAVGSAVAILVADKADIGNVGNAPTTAAAAPATPVAPASTPTSSAPAGQAPTGMSSIMMPALSSTMKEGKIVSWSKKVGDKI
jgi:pyruvate dehydrogenase E2 component (dihydrolipoamide acetyltransferase)